MTNLTNHEAIQKITDENPFEGMHISEDTILNNLEGRYPCPKCAKSRKYFCYSCYVPISELDGLIPVIKLPIKIDIIKHKHEIDGKSTAAHAAVLAPNDVRVFTYPDLPDYNNSNMVLIFPSYNAVTVEQLFQYNIGLLTKREELPKGCNQTTLMTKKVELQEKTDKYVISNNVPFEGAVFIDSTWNQSKGIYKDPRINQLRCVVLQNRISQFWRHQKGSPRWYLSTIEAIHQFVLEIHLNMWGVNLLYNGLNNCGLETIHRSSDILTYNGQYDNLLFFFKHMYKLIHTYYDHDRLYAYKRRLQ